MSQSRTTRVLVEDAVRFGTFANAFRVVEEVGHDCFLDFMVYSADSQEATVVARIRIRREFIHAIQEKLGDAICEFGDSNSDAAADSMTYRKTHGPLH